MRKKRAVVYDDDHVMRSALKRFLERCGYEVVAAPEPEVCAFYANQPRCDNQAPCSDVLLTDQRMPKMTGIELLKAQTDRGCTLTNRNKAIISGGLDEDSREQVRALGCAFFDKPVDLDLLKSWLAECEQRMDLSRPLGDKRKDVRESCCTSAICRTQAGTVVLAAEVVNRSDSGICIRVDSLPAARQVIHLDSDLPFPSSTFLVRWTKDLSSGKYLVGLSCD